MDDTWLPTACQVKSHPLSCFVSLSSIGLAPCPQGNENQIDPCRRSLIALEKRRETASTLHHFVGTLAPTFCRKFEWFASKRRFENDACVDQEAVGIGAEHRCMRETSCCPSKKRTPLGRAHTCHGSRQQSRCRLLSNTAGSSRHWPKVSDWWRRSILGRTHVGQ